MYDVILFVCTLEEKTVVLTGGDVAKVFSPCYLEFSVYHIRVHYGFRATIMVKI